MNKFLLLRSNKQTGPYTAEDLRQMGLKAYDLIWVEGKSAAWRYPGEIEDLKSFAPAVEEQPYDRFFKKQPEQVHKQLETSTASGIPVSNNSTANQNTQPQYPVTNSPSGFESQPAEVKPVKKEKEYKRVFVTLPSGSGNVHSYEQKPQQELPKASQYQPPVQQPDHKEPVAQQPFAEKLTRQQLLQEQKLRQQEIQQPLPSATTQPLTDTAEDEARNAEADNFLQQYYEKKAAISSSDNIPPNKPNVARPVAEQKQQVYYPKKRGFSLKSIPMAAIIIGMVCMIALGVFIGLSINNGSKPPVADNTAEKGSNQQSSLPVFSDSGKMEQPANNEQIVSKDKSTSEELKADKSLIIPTSKKRSEKTLDTNQQDIAFNQQDTDDPVAPVEKNDEPEEKKTVTKPAVPDLEKMVSVSSSDYEVGPFGGISGLAFTVKNTSGIDLNLVVVQVEYLKVNKEVFKTENLYFRDIAANSSLTIDAPRSGRGNKVNYKVTMINSKDHLFHAGN
ncbi:MAG TPA: hypothetical protein VGD17_04170 [Chitinophagaceae bacterium]